MRKKIKKRVRRNKEERAFLLSAVKAVLCLCICALMFMSGVIFQNDSLKESLYRLIRENSLGEKISVIKDEQPSKYLDKILGEAVFTSKAAEPVAIEGNITSPFGERVNPILEKEEFHVGVDIKAPKGQRVGALYPGKCEKVGLNKFDGNYCILSHGNFKTKYCHLDQVLISEGNCIRSGEAVGRVGRTGLATGNHLHVEIVKDGKYINPMSAFRDFTYEI